MGPSGGEVEIMKSRLRQRQSLSSDPCPLLHDEKEGFRLRSKTGHRVLLRGTFEPLGEPLLKNRQQVDGRLSTRLRRGDPVRQERREDGGMVPGPNNQALRSGCRHAKLLIKLQDLIQARVVPTG